MSRKGAEFERKKREKEEENKRRLLAIIKGETIREPKTTTWFKTRPAKRYRMSDCRDHDIRHGSRKKGGKYKWQKH